MNTRGSRLPVRSRLTRAALLAAVAAGGLVAVAAPARAVQPNQTVRTGLATITDVRVGGGTGNFVIVPRSGKVRVTGAYKIGNSGSAIDQIQIGYAGASTPSGCVYDGPGNRQGTFDVTLPAPVDPRPATVIVNFSQNFTCSTSGWWSSNTGPAIAEIAAAPRLINRNGPARFVDVDLDGSGSNAVVRAPGSAVTLTGAFTVDDTGGTSSALLIGWAGSNSPVGCVYEGSGRQRETAFTLALGPPPRSGATYVVGVHHTSCSIPSSVWKAHNTETTIALVYADRFAA